MRLISLLLCVFAALTSFSQKSRNYLKAAVGTNATFMDCATAIGYGVSGAIRAEHKSNLGYGLKFDVNTLVGGSKSLNVQTSSSYYFSGIAIGAMPTLDYSIYLLTRKRLEITPRLGAGIAFISSNGGFKEPNQGISNFNNYGANYVQPQFNSKGQLVNATAESKGLYVSINPAISFGYEVKDKTKLYLEYGYFFMYSDEIDGLNLPTASNESNDVFLTIQIGISKHINSFISQRRF